MFRHIFLFTISSIFLQTLKSQNILSNGNFESHGNLDCLSCIMWPEKYAAVLHGWKSVDGLYPFICDYQYQGDKLALEQGICPFEKVMPYDGKTMIEMDYAPSCYDQEMKTRGCSSYIGSQLGSKLEIGKVYEISFWTYILSSKDSTYANYIGFNLYPNVFRNPKGSMLEGSKFLLDTVIYNKWYQTKWLVRPICNLQFFVLGVFRGDNGPVVNTDGYQNRFYIDDVMIKAVYEPQDSFLYITPFCKYTAQEKSILWNETEGATLFFDSADSTLSKSSMILLDSFAIRAKKNPRTAFTISGNTDSIGFNHRELSKARVNSVLNYLENKHNIQGFRFFKIYFGKSNAIRPNTSEGNRQVNRRVEISQTNCDIEDVVYTMVREELHGGAELKTY